MDKRLCDLINVINLGIYGNIAGHTTDIIDDIDLEQLYLEAKRHNIQSYIYYCLRPFADHIKSINIDIWIKFEDANRQAIRKNMLLDAERSEIIKFFEANNIWYMPLKGIILQDYYPEYGTRQMADNDILVDVNYRNDIYRFMKNRGYSPEGCFRGYHDTYLKKPLYNFELHNSLVDKEHTMIYKYFNSIIITRDFLNTCSNQKKMSETDMYLYLISHAYIHNKYSGIGFKILIDIYYFINHFKDSVDWKGVIENGNRLGIDGFEQNIRSIVTFIFDNKLLSQNSIHNLKVEEYNLLLDMYNDGVYGKYEKKLKHGMRLARLDECDHSVINKMRYIRFRLFPDYDYLSKSYPCVADNKWMVPFCWIKRFYLILKRVDRLKAELIEIVNY